VNLSEELTWFSEQLTWFSEQLAWFSEQLAWFSEQLAWFSERPCRNDVPWHSLKVPRIFLECSLAFPESSLNVPWMLFASLEIAFQNDLRLTVQSTFLEKVDHTVEYGFKSWPRYCRLWFQKLTGLSTSKIFIQRLSTSQKKVSRQSIYDQKSTVDLKAWLFDTPWMLSLARIMYNV
jgi:hypothetical protein